MKKIALILLLPLLALVSCGDRGTSLPYFQDFEDPAFPPSGWETFPVGETQYNWDRSTAASGYGKGSACLMYNAFDVPASQIGKIYRGIRLPVMDFSGIKNPYVRFDIAAADRLTDLVAVSDTFGWWWNTDSTSGWNNSGWTLVQNYAGSTLTTAPPSESAFVPNSSQWKTVTLSVRAVANQKLLRLAVEDDFMGGNNIYLDNILVFDSVSAP